MEFIIRAAIEKFYASGQVETELEAVIKFNEEYIIPKCTQFNQSKWRYGNTFNVYVDNVVKVYEHLFKKLWSIYSGIHTKPGQKPAMMQDEFEAFAVASGLINDGLATSELSLIFDLSMITQVDELEKERHLNAQPLEFSSWRCSADWLTKQASHLLRKKMQMVK